MQIQDLFTPNTIAEITCLVVSVVCLSKDSVRIWKYSTGYLLITCITELFAIYLRKHHHNNQWPYNFLIIVEVLYIGFMFSNLFARYLRTKPFLVAGFISFVVLYSVDVFEHSILYLNDITNDTMSVVFTLFALYYFYLLLKEEQYTDLRYSADFWWVAGVLFFYFGDTTVNLLRGKIMLLFPDISLSTYIMIGINCILYSCWSYSFICRKWAVSALKT